MEHLHYVFQLSCIHTQWSVYWRVKMADTPILTIDLACLNAHTSWGMPLFSTFRSALITYTHKQLSTGNLVDDDRHTSIPIPTLDCLYKHTFLFHACRSVSMERFTQLAYLFLQCGTSFLSRDGRIADCTVRNLGVQCPFFSLFFFWLGNK